MTDFLACRGFRDGDAVTTRLAPVRLDELSPGEVVVRVLYSGLNFKDALAVTGRGKIYRRFPLNAGIDLAGTVESSSDPRFSPGDAVLANGMGLGELHDGGLAQMARLPADWVVPMPTGLDAREAMSLGTAGFTAALALHRMEQLGQVPGMGPIAVTGASGGVGSFAVALFARRGYRVVAVSSREEHHAYLRELGAEETSTPAGLALGSRPLEAARFGGAVDNVGGDLLSALTRHVAPWGSIASVGNAASPKLETTVFPFILRGLSLLGISSADCPMPLRREVWNRLGADLKPRALDAVVADTVPLEEAIPACTRLLERRFRGRVVVRTGA